MRNDLTDITILLDRSGSMERIRDDTIGGFNAFLKLQREFPGECAITLVQFDDTRDTIYVAKPVREARFLTRETFVPRSCTALLDAIGHTIEATGKRLASLSEEDRPGKVIFVILTDGRENASRDYKRLDIFQMIGHQRGIYQWEFVFLGANQDAIHEAGGIGITRDDALTYNTGPQQVRDVYTSVATKVRKFRSGATGQSAAFTEEDRQLQGGAPPKDAGA